MGKYIVKKLLLKAVLFNGGITRISFMYSLNVNTGTYYDTIEGTVVPDIQYS